MLARYSGGFVGHTSHIKDLTLEVERFVHTMLFVSLATIGKSVNNILFSSCWAQQLSLFFFKIKFCIDGVNC